MIQPTMTGIDTHHDLARQVLFQTRQGCLTGFGVRKFAGSNRWRFLGEGPEAAVVSLPSASAAAAGCGSPNSSMTAFTMSWNSGP